MSNRSTILIGKVLRDLRRHGVSDSSLKDEEIYSELSQGQDNIISEINTDKIIPITLSTGIDTYSLSTDTITDENLPLRMNIASIKIVELPIAWRRYGFEVIPNNEFVQKVNSNPSTPIAHPVIGTVIDNKLKIYPAPSSDYNGIVLEFFVYLISSTQKITKDTEPELPEIWDKSLEYYAVSSIS